MNRYFLGLALALLAIPGVSRADVVQTVLSNSPFTDTGASAGTLSGGNIVFSTPGSYNSSFLSSFVLRVKNTSGTQLDGLGLTFSLSGLSAGTVFTGFTPTANTDAISANGFGNSSWSLSPAANMPSGADTYTLSWTISSISSVGNVITNNDLKWATTTTMVTDPSANGWTFGSSSTANGGFLLTANVPEPATILLTGSVIACGFGASVLRRFRKKPETQEAAV